MKYFSKIKPMLLLAFFYILFTFTFNKISTVQTLIIYGICVIYILINIKYLIKYILIVKNGCLKYSVIAIMICVIAAILVPIIYKTLDFSYLDVLVSIARTTIKLLALLILFEKKHKDEANIYLFSKYVIIATNMYILTTIFFVIFPGLKEAWNKIIYDPSYHIILENANYMTRYGIDGYSGFQIAFKVIFAVIINGFLIIEENLKIKKENVMLYISYIMLLVGSTLYGRIGATVSAISAIILAFIFIKKDKKNLLYIGSFIIVIATILTILYICNGTMKIWMDWAFAPIINFIKTGKLYTGSSDIVFDRMIFMPNIRTFFFGDGYYTAPYSNYYYMSTDVGFMRPMLFYGIIFTIIGYLSIIIPIIKLISQSIKQKNKALTFLSINFLITIIIEIKGEIFYRFLPLVVIYIILLQLNSNNDININQISKSVIPNKLILLFKNSKNYFYERRKNSK